MLLFILNRHLGLQPRLDPALNFGFFGSRSFLLPLFQPLLQLTPFSFRQDNALNLLRVSYCADVRYRFPMPHAEDFGFLLSARQRQKSEEKPNLFTALYSFAGNKLRGAGIYGDLPWRGVYESARRPITASPHR